jgi:nuclear cap-binding protein subunit 1
LRWHEEVSSIATLFIDNYEDELLRSNFVELIHQLVVEQPLKTPFLAAVVLVTNASKPEVVDNLLGKVASVTESMIKEGDWRGVKLNLKFLACLHSCLSGDGLFPLLEELFSRAVDLQTASSDDVRLATLSGMRWRLTSYRQSGQSLSKSSS